MIGNREPRQLLEIHVHVFRDLLGAFGQDGVSHLLGHQLDAGQFMRRALLAGQGIADDLVRCAPSGLP